MAQYYYDKHQINEFWDKDSNNAVDSQTLYDSTTTSQQSINDNESYYPFPNQFYDGEGIYKGYTVVVKETVEGFDNHGFDLTDYDAFPVDANQYCYEIRDRGQVGGGEFDEKDQFDNVYYNRDTIIELDTYEIYKHQEKGTFIETIVADDGDYPDDGLQGGYWWVKQDKPTVTLDPIGDKSVNVTNTLDFYITASIDGDSGISYSINNKPPGASFGSNGHFVWTPEQNQGGTYDVTFSASANGSTDSETITITVVSPYPRIEAISNKSVDENQPLSFTVNTNDPDNDTIQCYIKSGQPTGSSFSFSGTSGTFEWTPDYTQAGSYTVTFEAEANGYYDTETAEITVNDVLPELDPIGDKIVDENKNLNFTVNATISDDSTITLSAKGVPSGATFDASTGVFDWTPTFFQSGSYDVTFEAEANGDVDSETITITVNEIHKAPENLSPVSNYETLNRKPYFEMDLPANSNNDTLLYHARLRIAENIEMTNLEFLLESKDDQSLWEYYDGSSWVAMPEEGVPAGTRVRVQPPQALDFSFHYWDAASWEVSYEYGLNTNVRKINILISTEDPYVLDIEGTQYQAYSITAKETSNGEIGEITFALNNKGNTADANINYGDVVLLAINDELGNQEQFRGRVKDKNPSSTDLQVKAVLGEGILSERIIDKDYSSQDIGLIAKDIIDTYCSPLTSNGINTSTGITAPTKALNKTPLKVFEQLRRQHGIFYFVDANWDVNFYLPSEIGSYTVNIRRGD